MTAPYQKDLSHLPWHEVYHRQVLRAPLLEDWFAALELRPGMRILDIGCGPGFVSIEAAQSVGPDGRVYAVDRSAEALAYLEQAQAERGGLPQIQRLVADATALDLPEPPIDAALVTMMLHHVDDPPALLRHVAELLPPGVRVLIAEFHPDGPCQEGPPREERVAPEQVRAWCEAAGLTVGDYVRQTPEHYRFAAVRA